MTQYFMLIEVDHQTTIACCSLKYPPNTLNNVPSCFGNQTDHKGYINEEVEDVICVKLQSES